MSILQKLHSAKNYLLVFGAVAIIGLSSCEKDDTTSPTGITIGGSFPTTSGSYWVYENKETDTNGVLIPEVIGLDSTVAGNSYSLDGQTAVDFMTYSTNESGEWNMEGSKSTYAKESNIVYISTNEIISGLGEGFPFSIGDVTNIEKWVIAMQDKPTWDMLTFPIEVAEFELPGVPLPAKMQLNGTLKMSGAKIGTENVTIAGKTYSAMKFAMTSGMEAKLQLGEQFLFFAKGTDVAVIKFPNVTNLYIVDGIGIVKTETMPSSTSITVVPAFETIAAGAGFGSQVTKNGGEVSTLIRHKIK
jgi:hypothetical protein